MGRDPGIVLIRFLAIRAGRLLAILVVASVLVFAAIYAAPGSALSALSGGRNLTAHQIEVLEAEHHLDEPIPAQYWSWLKGAVHGDFGKSVLNGESVSSLIGERVGATALLVAYAAILIAVFSLLLGSLAALRGGWTDSAIVAATSAMAAVPSFVAAGVLTAFLAVDLGWFPALGDGAGLPSQLWHLTLPAISLALAGIGFCGRVTRTAVSQELDTDHVGISRTRGIPERRLIRRHVLRNAALPVLTANGIIIAGLIAGAVVVEKAFALNGLGTLLVESVTAKNYPVVQGVTLILVATFVLVNTLVDAVGPLLDPRVALGARDVD